MTVDTLHHTWTDRLSAYVDDELAPAEREEMDRHLSGCETCRDLLASLSRVVTHARALNDQPPATDHWPVIAATVRHVQPRRVVLSVPKLVAASLFIALVGGLSALAMLGGTRLPATSAVQPSALALPVVLDDAVSARAADDLLHTLNQNRATLDPKTVEVVERSLATIDKAILEARSALSADPGNVYLSNHLARERRLKLAVLRRVNNLTEVRQ